MTHPTRRPSSRAHRRAARAAARAAAPLALPVAALALAFGAAALLPAVTNPLHAQTPAARGTGRITGSISDPNGQPLASVQVSVVGTRLGALTGSDGRFTIAGVPAGTYTVRAQRIGYVPGTQQVTVSDGGTASVDLRLATTTTQLTAQVVVGYTTQQRRDVSDATAGVRGDDIRDQKVATVEEAVRGRIPGVQVLASGEPGRPPQINIRGQATLARNASPLYVVDGVYMSQNPNLNPNDIENIEVLKDASAAAQYGAQAANGVVVIRTRRGREGDNQVDLRSYYGFQDVPNRIEMMDARSWAEVQRQAFVNAGRENEIPTSVSQALQGQGISTDWQDAVFQRGAIQDHNLSIAGGTGTANYLVSGGFLQQTGSIIQTGFNRYSFRANSELRRGRFTFGENVAVSQTNRRELLDATDGGVLIQALRFLPTIPVRDEQNVGGYGFGSDAAPTFGYNPVGLQETRPRNYRSNQVIGSAYAEASLPFNLRYRLNAGVNYNGDRFAAFNSIAQVRFRTPEQFANFSDRRGQFVSTIVENLLTYDQTLGGAHRLNAVAGYTQQRESAEDLFAFRQGYADEGLRTINAGEQNGQRTAGGLRRTNLASLLARANYSFRDRYLLTGSVRRDGSSRFGANSRYGTFGAGSIGWVVSEEGFFDAIPLLNRAELLKLRASTGVLGLQDIADYATSAVLNQTSNYLFGNSPNVGTTQLVIANPNLRWQSNRMSNVGLDLALPGDRWTVTADYYVATQSGLLVQVPLPVSLGATADPFVNAGRMRNAGVELGTTYRFVRGGFELNTTGTMTTTRNRVLSLGGGRPINAGPAQVARTLEGQPLGSFYVIRTGGIFQSADEVQAHTSTVNGRTVVIQPNARPGDVRYLDVAGGGPDGTQPDGQITDADRVNVGNGTPRYQGGLFFDSRYRAFDFGLNFRGAGGFKIFNFVRYWTDRTDDPSNFRAGFSPWTPENPSTTTPRALARGNDNVRVASDRWVEDGDFLRVQNIVLGFRIPATLTRRLGANVQSPRIYVNVQNAATFTGYTGWDPEALGGGDQLGRGIDAGRIYPQVRTITLGVDLRL